MPSTRTDLIVEVLDLLGVTEVGQDPSAEDSELVDRKIDGIVARLARRNVVYVQDVGIVGQTTGGAIEDEFFDPLAVIVANNVGPKFGRGFDPATDMRQEMLLREMQSEPGAEDTVHACYF